MQLIRKFNKGFRFLLCLIDIYSKDAWVVFLKDKKEITITNAFQKILDESKRKPDKVWVDKSNNRSIKSFLLNKGGEMYATHNEEKSVIAERFIRALKNKIYKYMIFARCSLFFAFCSLLFARRSLFSVCFALLSASCSLFFARYFLLVAHYFLLIALYFLLVTFCLLLVTFYSLLFTFCLLLVTFCLLRVNFCLLHHML